MSPTNRKPATRKPKKKPGTSARATAKKTAKKTLGPARVGPARVPAATGGTLGLDLLVRNLDRAFHKSSWHGPNFRNSIRGVDHELAAWRPQPERHNIWELTVHAAYWKYAVHRLVTGDTTIGFGIRGSNWFERPEAATARAWRGDLRHLDEWHDRLRSAVAAFDRSRLDRKPSPKSQWNFEDLIVGAAAHDIYHAGQIRLLRRMAGSR